MNSVTFKFWVTLAFSRHKVTLSQNILIFVSNTSQPIGLVHFIINDWNYLVFWKKLALNQVLGFLSVSVYKKCTDKNLWHSGRSSVPMFSGNSSCFLCFCICKIKVHFCLVGMGLSEMSRTSKCRQYPQKIQLKCLIVCLTFYSPDINIVVILSHLPKRGEIVWLPSKVCIYSDPHYLDKTKVVFRQTYEQ